MTILVIADNEALLEARTKTKNQIDLVISCGDLSDDVILETAERKDCQQILAVKGNHDSSGDFRHPIKDIHLDKVEIGGLRFGGFGGAWKYKPKGNYLYDRMEVSSLLARFPAVDVFVAHNSPRYVHDQEDEVHL